MLWHSYTLKSHRTACDHYSQSRSFILALYVVFEPTWCVIVTRLFGQIVIRLEENNFHIFFFVNTIVFRRKITVVFVTVMSVNVL